MHLRQGFFSIQQTCPNCHGSGKIIPEPCATCSGAGRLKRQKTLEVKIPPGINEGMRIRSAGNGEPGTNGGPPGDLYIEIRIRQHEIFERDGDDLHCTVPVSFTTAALGGSIEVPTLEGKAEITLPESTQHGKTFVPLDDQLGLAGHVRGSFLWPSTPLSLPIRFCRAGRDAGAVHMVRAYDLVQSRQT